MPKAVLFGLALMITLTPSGIGAMAEETIVPMEAGHTAVSAHFKIGESGSGAVIVNFVDGTNPIRLPIRAEPQEFSVGFDGWTKHNLPDGILSVSGVDYFARPRVRRYRAKMPSGFTRWTRTRGLWN